MSEHHPFIEPPDPFSAMGPDGGHFQPGVPADMPVPGDEAATVPPTPPGGPSYSPPPPPGYTPPGGVMVGEERMWSTLIPLSTFVAAFIGPLVLWLIFRNQYPGVDRTGRETLNFQFSLFIYFVMLGILSIILIGVPFLIMLPIFGFVCTVIAAYRTSRGEFYEYPLTIRLL